MNTQTATDMADDDPRSVGSRITKARETVGYRQHELAALLKITRGNVNNWESGHNLPPTKHLRALCALLDVNIHWLITGNHGPRTYATNSN